MDEDEDYFHQAIDSVLSQSVKLRLIINTLPGDPSIKHIEQYKRDNIIIYLTQRNKHPGKNPDGSFYQLNRALSLINTEWFVFASSNCVIDKDKYKKEIKAANKKGGYIGYSNLYKVNSGLKNKKPSIHGEYSYKRHLKGNFIPDQSVINYSKLRDLLPFKINWYNMGFWDFWLRVYEKHGDVFGYCNEFTRYYRQDKKQMHIQLMNLQEKSKRKQAKTLMLKTHG